MRGYYRLEEGAAGWYTADVRASLETFKHYTEASTGGLFAEPFARGNQAYNPLFSNKIRFEDPPCGGDNQNGRSGRNVNMGGTHSGKKNKALENAEVRRIGSRKSPSVIEAFGTEAYRKAWNRVRPNRSLLTNSEGKAVFSGIQRDAYLLLARHPEFFGVAITGSLIPKVDGRWQPGKVVEANPSVVH